MKRCFVQKYAAVVIAFEEVARNEVSRYGIAKPKSEGDILEIEDFIEKPSVS